MVLELKLKELGERKILEKIVFPYLDVNANPLGLDEDAVAFKLADERYLIINVDTFVRKTDAPPQMNYYEMGFKVVVMTISDLLAKGAIPSFLLLSISAPPDLSDNELESIVMGVKAACERYRAYFLGGDLGAADDIILTGIGVGFSSKLIPRNGATPGDTVWATGMFGLTGAALHHFLKEGHAPKTLLSTITGAYFYPPLSVEDGMAISKIAVAAMDSSDGLAVTLNTIARMSKVRIELETIPIAKEALEYAKINKIDPYELALFAGEEFEIIFTVRDLADNEVIKIFQECNARTPIKIGRVVEGSGVYFRGMKIPERGWEHFLGENE